MHRQQQSTVASTSTPNSQQQLHLSLFLFFLAGSADEGDRNFPPLYSKVLLILIKMDSQSTVTDRKREDSIAIIELGACSASKFNLINNSIIKQCCCAETQTSSPPSISRAQTSTLPSAAQLPAAHRRRRRRRQSDLRWTLAVLVHDAAAPAPHAKKGGAS